MTSKQLISAILIAILSAYSLPARSVTIDLGNLVAGGDGLGNPLPGNEGMNCLDPATGQFLYSELLTDYRIHNGFQTVAGSPFVDGAFVMYPRTLPINSAGVSYTILPGDESDSYDYITDNREPGRTGPIVLNGVTYSAGIGIHAAAGVTFDLRALGTFYSTNFNFFSADFGCIGNPTGLQKVRGYAVFSDDTNILSSVITPLMIITDQPFQFRLPIPPNATYLTLIAGDGGDGMASDHTGFGNAFLTRHIANWKGGIDDTKTAWGVAGNWDSGMVPDQAGVDVCFGNQSSNNGIVDLVSAGRTVGDISFASTTSTTIRSTYGFALTLDNLGGISTIDVVGSHTISAPVIINNDVKISGLGTLNLSGGISGNHALTILGNITASSIEADTLIIGSAGTAQAVPEPSAFVMLLSIALGGMLWCKRCKTYTP